MKKRNKVLATKAITLIPKVASNLNMPEEEVAEVINHMFEFLKDYLKRPTKAGIRFLFWGVIRPYHPTLMLWLRNAIIRMRKDPSNEDLKDRFRYL